MDWTRQWDERPTPTTPMKTSLHDSPFRNPKPGPADNTSQACIVRGSLHRFDVRFPSFACRRQTFALGSPLALTYFFPSRWAFCVHESELGAGSASSGSEDWDYLWATREMNHWIEQRLYSGAAACWACKDKDSYSMAESSLGEQCWSRWKKMLMTELPRTQGPRHLLFWWMHLQNNKLRGAWSAELHLHVLLPTLVIFFHCSSCSTIWSRPPPWPIPAAHGPNTPQIMRPQKDHCTEFSSQSSYSTCFHTWHNSQLRAFNSAILAKTPASARTGCKWRLGFVYLGWWEAQKWKAWMVRVHLGLGQAVRTGERVDGCEGRLNGQNCNDIYKKYNQWLSEYSPDPSSQRRCAPTLPNNDIPPSSAAA